MVRSSNIFRLRTVELSRTRVLTLKGILSKVAPHTPDLAVESGEILGIAGLVERVAPSSSTPCSE
jgi:ABC-type sugar transport system ATPase subunit